MKTSLMERRSRSVACPIQEHLPSPVEIKKKYSPRDEKAPLELGGGPRDAGKIGKERAGLNTRQPDFRAIQRCALRVAIDD
ncbi:MAG: hypothetical protein QM766_25670 [Burkholderiaceae bacterium]